MEQVISLLKLLSFQVKAKKQFYDGQVLEQPVFHNQNYFEAIHV